MPGLFTSIRLKRPRRNKFDLSHTKKMSLNMGALVPIMCQEILPGDAFRVKSEIMLRLAPMLAPIMHQVNVTTHYFFVPNRIIWDEWEDFITGGREGTSTPVHPFLPLNDTTYTRFTPGSLADYLGMPVGFDGGNPLNPVNVSVLPFRAYQTIYNEYYRDQNLSAPIDISKTSGNQVAVGAQLDNLTEIRNRAWEKDYFTSALPWAQRGPEVLMPIEGEGAVTYMPQSVVVDATNDPVSSNNVLGTIVPGIGVDGGLMVGDVAGITPADPFAGNQNVRIENIDEVTIDNATTTINDLRRSIRLQEWLEKNARGGARYVEQILSHFGVRGDDARLQRPEYLGGGRAPVTISEVLSTATNFDAEGEPIGNAQGNMSGHGVSFGTTNGFKRRFKEHGFVIGLMSVLPRTAYQQGLSRMWTRFDKFDYAWPEFANIGEQEIKEKEIYYNGADSTPEQTWGYQSRYAEYKFGQSTVHGDFRNSLAYWHMGRIFGAPPPLNEAFVQSDPTTRIFAVEDPDADKLYCQLFNRVDAIRPLPYFGTPTL